jgi:hypothetical protein
MVVKRRARRQRSPVGGAGASKAQACDVSRSLRRETSREEACQAIGLPCFIPAENESRSKSHEQALRSQFGCEIVEGNGVGDNLRRGQESERRGQESKLRAPSRCGSLRLTRDEGVVAHNLDDTGARFCGEHAVGAHEHVDARLAPHALEPRHQLRRRSHTNGGGNRSRDYLQGKCFLYEIVARLYDCGQEIVAVSGAAGRSCRRHVSRAAVVPKLGEYDAG